MGAGRYSAVLTAAAPCCNELAGPCIKSGVEIDTFHELWKTWRKSISDTEMNPKQISLNKRLEGLLPLMKWSQISRWNYKVGILMPPEQTLYTIFTIGQHFFFLIGLFLINITLQLMMKRLTNPNVFKKLSYIDCFIHAICCSFIPHPMEEWDEDSGHVSMHKMRKKCVLKEMLASIMINFGINLSLLSPLIILGTW